MTLAWLREAAVAAQAAAQKHVEVKPNADFVALEQTREEPEPTREHVVPWRRIDNVGSGIFICGAAALEDQATLDRLGVRSILNCGEEDIYRRSYTCPDGTSLRQRLSNYRLEVLEAADMEEQPMSEAFERGCSFIDASLTSGGGVAVHCLSGVSRSSSVCLAYLMTREGLSLESAFRRVFQARDYIRPNAGFWQQLRELEQKLGRPLQVACHEDAAGKAITRLDAEVDSRRAAMAAGWF